MRFILQTLLLFGLALPAAHAQEVKPVDPGLSVTYDNPEGRFSFLLPGKRVEQTPRSNVFTVDGRLVQTLSVPSSVYDTREHLTEAGELAALEHYAVSEIDYLMEHYGEQVDLRMRSLELEDGHMALIYRFEMPTEDAEVAEQLYVTRFCEQQIFSLNVPLKQPKEYGESLTMMLKAANSVRCSTRGH